jgi:photosystem II stability/assembly factor-like uncharacterized protein
MKSIPLFLQLLFASFLFCSFGIVAQSGWFPQGLGPTNQDLSDVCFIDTYTGTAVGTAGTIIRTTDGGTTWEIQSSGTANSLSGVSFTDANNGTAIGQSGTIVRTTDGGTTWVSQASGTTNNLYGVSFTDASTGTAVGFSGTILRTTDGGSTWVSQVSGTTETLNDVCFTDANHGTAVGWMIILHTTDGGQTWSSYPLSPGQDLQGVSFPDATNGFAVGYDQGAANWSLVLHTTNGGTTWTSQNAPIGGYLLDVSFSDANNGTAIDMDGEIMHTINGGTTWTPQASGALVYLSGVSMTDASTGTIVGVGGLILRTTNGGNTWISIGTFNGSLNGVSLPDADHGTAVGIMGKIIHTTDGGATWTEQACGVLATLNSVCFTDVNTGTVAGDQGTILRTTNGGITWTSQVSGTTKNLRGVCFTDANTGTVVGQDGKILHTTNGGITWTSQVSGTTYNLNGVCFTDANTGTAVGNNGIILRTTNGGATWTIQASGTTNYINDVFFLDTNNGWAAANGRILHTSNGGDNWTSQLSGNIGSCYGIIFTDANHGVVVGASEHAFIRQTDDGGATWTLELSGIPGVFFDVSFADEIHGNAVGCDGLLYRTNTGGFLFNYDASLAAIGNIPVYSCKGTCAPVVTLRNNGAQSLTSATLKYSVNGGNITSYSWTGNLATNQATEVSLPTSSFNVLPVNLMKAYVTDPNGQPDQNHANDTIQKSFIEADTLTQVVTLELKTDNNPGETTWTLENSYGQLLYSGGPYAQPNTVYLETFNLTNNDCYVFTIHDAGGNGICCVNGSGYYKLKNLSGAIYYQGGVFGSSEIVEFNIQSGFQINLKVMLEGPYSGDEMFNFLNLYGYLPLNQPYNIPPWNYFGTESVAGIPSGVVDWVLVELRETTGGASTATPDKIIGQKAAFVLTDGNIVDVDGISLPKFNLVISNNLFVIIWHRNHLGVMSAIPLTATGTVYSYDFTTGAGQAFGGSNGHKHLGGNVYGMYAGDGDANGQIQNADKIEIWKPQSGNSGYYTGDFNLSGTVDNQDKIDRWWPNAGRSCQVPQ